MPAPFMIHVLERGKVLVDRAVEYAHKGSIFTRALSSNI
jgi:hypothetical protein